MLHLSYILPKMQWLLTIYLFTFLLFINLFSWYYTHTLDENQKRILIKQKCNGLLQIKDILLLKQKDVSDFVCLFPNSSKTTKPDELKFWGMIPLGMQKVLG